MNKLMVVAILAMAAVGCGGNVCGPGTEMVDDTCVASAADLSVVIPDGGTAGTTCGANTTLENGVCVLAAGACMNGAVFDVNTKTCVAKLADNGTLVKADPMKTVYSNVFFAAPDADAGMIYTPVGTFDTQSGMLAGAPLPDTTPLFLKDGRPLMGRTGMKGKGSVAGLIDILPTVTTQVTLGDYKSCKGTVAWYKPTDGTKKYRLVMDLTGCIKDSVYGVWIHYSDSDLTVPRATRFANVTMGTYPYWPNTMTTDANGQGHFERLLDPEVWFKPGVSCPQCFSHGPTTFPAATGSILVSAVFHPQGIASANIGLCPLDPATGNCFNPNSAANPTVEIARIPGLIGTSASFVITSEFPLSDLQPF